MIKDSHRVGARESGSRDSPTDASQACRVARLYLLHMSPRYLSTQELCPHYTSLLTRTPSRYHYLRLAKYGRRCGRLRCKSNSRLDDKNLGLNALSRFEWQCHYLTAVPGSRMIALHYLDTEHSRVSRSSDRTFNVLQSTDALRRFPNRNCGVA